MRVRLFVGSLEETFNFEQKINDFIQDKKVIDIKYSNSNYTEQDAVSDMFYGEKVCSALVMYDEDYGSIHTVGTKENLTILDSAIADTVEERLSED